VTATLTNAGAGAAGSLQPARILAHPTAATAIRLRAAFPRRA
jgi:hypothetical protein